MSGETYVGMYLVVPKIEKKIILPPKIVCTKSKKHQCPDKAMFCPVCGAVAKTVIDKTTEMVPLNPIDVSYVGEAFFTPTYYAYTQDVVWICNFTNEHPSCTNGPINLTGAVIQKYEEDFIKKYGEMIKQLEADYKIKIETHFGVLNYWN